MDLGLVEAPMTATADGLSSFEISLLRYVVVSVMSQYPREQA